MTKKRIKTYFLAFPFLILIIVLFSLENVWSARLFVKPGGFGNSCSQSTPCLFTTALTNADPRDTIFFRQGTYTRNASSVVRIEKDVFLYGGWDGSPSGAPIVNPELYPSILDGGNLRPVIHILGPIWAIIKGFTIQNGNARDLPEQTVVCEGDMTPGCGGGIYVYEAKALIEDNQIRNNKADAGKGNGGGVHLERASGTIARNNLFHGNQAKKAGGGLNLYGSASIPPEIKDNRFIQNSAGIGGAIGFYQQTNSTIQDNLFDNNSATSYGAGMVGLESAAIARNLFQNHLGHSVAALFNFQGTFNANRLVNNTTEFGLVLLDGTPPYPTVSNNIIARSGASYALLLSGESSDFQLNAVVEHNTLVGEGLGAAIGAGGYFNLNFNNNIISAYPTGIKSEGAAAFVTARHTLFDGSVTTHGDNVNFINSLVGDPAFKDPATNDYHIRFASAARDAGTSVFVTTTQDIDGDPRVIGSAPDIGADEYKPAGYLYLPLIMK
jgi:hypothetical protein